MVQWERSGFMGLRLTRRLRNDNGVIDGIDGAWNGLRAEGTVRRGYRQIVQGAWEYRTRSHEGKLPGES